MDHPKIVKKRSTFTHPHVFPKLYEFLSYVEDKKDILRGFFCPRGQWAPILLDYQRSLKYLLLCSVEEKFFYRFGTT